MIKKAVKYSLWLVIILITLIIMVLLFIDPIAKYAIQKYDKQYLGREISINRIHINILNASVEINDFKLFEKMVKPHL